MPRQRINHGRIVYVMPDDFPQRLGRLKEESGLSWAEIARCIFERTPRRPPGRLTECQDSGLTTAE